VPGNGRSITPTSVGKPRRNVEFEDISDEILCVDAFAAFWTAT
jgi:hypothetical protein